MRFSCLKSYIQNFSFVKQVFYRNHFVAYIRINTAQSRFGWPNFTYLCPSPYVFIHHKTLCSKLEYGYVAPSPEQSSIALQKLQKQTA